MPIRYLHRAVANERGNGEPGAHSPVLLCICLKPMQANKQHLSVGKNPLRGEGKGGSLVLTSGWICKLPSQRIFGDRTSQRAFHAMHPANNKGDIYFFIFIISLSSPTLPVISGSPMVFKGWKPQGPAPRPKSVPLMAAGAGSDPGDAVQYAPGMPGIHGGE